MNTLSKYVNTLNGDYGSFQDSQENMGSTNIQLNHNMNQQTLEVVFYKSHVQGSPL